MPSTEPEAFGRSAVEAQAMGAMVVVSDIGAVPETVLAPPEVAEGERTGWRIPPGDPDALAEALMTALTPRRQRARSDRLARPRSRREAFFLQQMKDATLAAYLSLLPA